MRFLFFAALIGAAYWFWQNGGMGSTAAFDKAGKPIVVMLTVDGCPPCQDAANQLRSRGVPFQEKRINPDDGQNPDVQLWHKVGNNLFPVTLSGNGKVTNSSKWELIGLLGDNFKDRYLLPEEKYYFQQHVDANGAPRIVLYGTSWCPSCAAMRKDFREHNVDFVDIDVERSGEFERLIRLMEIPGYPAVWVGYTRVHGVTYNDVMNVVKKKS